MSLAFSAKSRGLASDRTASVCRRRLTLVLTTCGKLKRWMDMSLMNQRWKLIPHDARKQNWKFISKRVVEVDCLWCKKTTWGVWSSEFNVLAPSGALIAIPTYYWPTTTNHFFRSHQSSTLDFHFLSHDSYIKAIILHKGNRCNGLIRCQSLHVYLMGTTGHHCKIVQDSARSCKIVQDIAR